MQPPDSPQYQTGYRQPPPPGPEPELKAMDALGFGLRALRDHTGDVLMAVLMMLIPIVGPIVVRGWMAELLQRLERGEPEPVVPLRFDDFSLRLNQGLASFLVQLVFGMVLGMVIGFPMGLLGAFVPFLARGGGDGSAVTLALLGGVGLPIVLVAAFLGGLLLTGAELRAELTEDVSASLNPSAAWDFARRVWGRWLVAGIALALLGVGVALAGMLVCFVGVYVAVVVLQLSALHLRWQTYRLYLYRGGAPIPVKAPPRPVPPGGFPGTPTAGPY